MEYPIEVKFEYTNNVYKASQWLANLPDTFAADFETASKWNKQDKKVLKYRLDNFDLDDETRRRYLQEYTSSGLSYPALVNITHLNIAWSNHEAYVIVCDTDAIRKMVYSYLISTDRFQIWHNCSFDFYHIYYHTHMFPKNFVDTMLLAKSLINDANNFRNKVGLKDLMGYAYGAWAIAKDNFELENMWNPDVLKYSATDACATYKLYEDIQEELHKWRLS